MQSVVKLPRHDNLTIAAGGFGLCGNPENLIAALSDSSYRFCNSARSQFGSR
jgi:acyl CoA:acetate/3-ketoacid CoA transferase alpha subunit